MTGWGLPPLLGVGCLQLPHQPGPQGKGPGGEGTPGMAQDLPVLFLKPISQLSGHTEGKYLHVVKEGWEVAIPHFELYFG